MSERIPSIAHILVVGFHHQKGATVEFSYPPLHTSDGEDVEQQSITNLLPAEWRFLPYLALPDGCHNYDEDSVYFSLPCPETAKISKSGSLGSVVHGIACCRQVDAKDLLSRNEELTRSTVQKSVCVLSRIPIFGFIEAKLNLITHAYFNSKDFSEVSILRDAYDSLNATLSASLSPELLSLGLSQQDLVIQYHHRLLQILKAVLLRKRVVVFGQPAKSVSNAVLSIASLLPGTLASLLKGSIIDKDGYGFPLDVFSESLSIQPYVCLQQMDLLMDEQSPCIIAGVVNPLFEKQKEKICSVFVNLIDGLVTVVDPALKSQLHLSSADLRFCSVLSKSMQRTPTSPTSPFESDGSKLQYSDWLGSNEWILAQFKLYLLSLLATSTSAHTPALDDFNPEFMVVWLKSSVFTNWYKNHGNSKKISDVEPKHVCEGSLSIGDLKRRLVAQASDYGLNIQSKEQVTSAVHQTQKAVSSAVSSMWSSASSAVHQWWYPDQNKPTTDKENYS
jgi:hypothetical protein